MNVNAERMTELMNNEWTLEGGTVAERAASWYRLGASPISAKAAVKREIEALPGGADVALRFWQSGKIKNEAIEAGIVAEIARLEQVAK